MTVRMPAPRHLATRLDGRGLGRIDHPLEAGEGQVAQVGVEQVAMAGVHLAEGEAQGAQGLAGEDPGRVQVVTR